MSCSKRLKIRTWSLSRSVYHCKKIDFVCIKESEVTMKEGGGGGGGGLNPPTRIGLNYHHYCYYLTINIIACLLELTTDLKGFSFYEHITSGRKTKT